ncbi:MAG: arsenate reductase/protein-tyrosine-phosphatase family protein, partial [Candidatus Geothermincolia bacterium]
MDKLTLLFVCTGNLCRSVMAEGFLRATQAQRGTELVTLDSAGVNAV